MCQLQKTITTLVLALGGVVFAHASVLPPYDFASERALPRTMRLDQVVFTGNVVVSSDELQRVAHPYLNRELDPSTLKELQDALTLYYVGQGYVTSGAIVDRWDAGVLHVRLVEGIIIGVQATSDDLRPRFLADQLSSQVTNKPVNVMSLDQALQVLQQDPHVRRIDAQLVPTEQRGQSMLTLNTETTDRFVWRVDLANDQSPAVGEWRGNVSMALRNVMGRSDDLLLDVGATEGSEDYGLSYDFPLKSHRTRLTLYGRYSDSEIVEPPFDDLGIEADTVTFGLNLDQQLYRSVAVDVGVFGVLEKRRSRTFLLGSGFSFIEGPDEGQAELTALRLGWRGSYRGERTALHARLQFSRGLDRFGATWSSGPQPDGDFSAWFARMQIARRLRWLSSELALRVDAQLSEDPLLGVEQYTIGGRYSVRGYRENTLSRDSAVLGSLEWRVPIRVDPNGSARLLLTTFVDWSHSWNVERDELGPKELGSVGLGLSGRIVKNLRFEAYWGKRLQRLRYPGPFSLQDEGLHLRLHWNSE